MPTQQRLRVGPYAYRVSSELPQVDAALETLYGDFPRVEDDAFIDFDVGLRAARTPPWRPRRAIFQFDRRDQFAAVEANQAFATLEWGMNWCVSVYCNSYLKLHAAVVADDQGAIIMPGLPGAGKSTLCALLAMNGWRVLSDEHALIVPGTATVVPLYRPISLKNDSIPLVRGLFPGAVFGPVTEDTHKGTVAHLKADNHPLTFDRDPLPVRAVVFPSYTAGEHQRLTRAPKTRSFLVAAHHSFNYSLLGKAGFQAMRALMHAVPCLNLQYHDVDWALRAFERVVQEAAAA